MAISYVHWKIMNDNKDLLPQGGSILNIGEPNWYGDADPVECGLEPSDDPFAIARQFQEQLMCPSKISNIDLHGTERSLKIDLNWMDFRAIEHSVVVNHGTSEHVFNIARVFRVMHECCLTGGLMIHEAPCTGWVNHGFYCLQPALFYDLARANEYQLERIYITDIWSRLIWRVETEEAMGIIASRENNQGLPEDSLLFVILRKTNDKIFKMPMQKVYLPEVVGMIRKAEHGET